ncbi:DUF2905 domain-containing protein [Chloroflexi bacterium CFX6]|nr:DUF2905 domain-containing protein [Chloroflexi bacterium CFX6]
MIPRLACKPHTDIVAGRGNIRIGGDIVSFYLPITSLILVSVVLTIVLNVIVRLLKK